LEKPGRWKLEEIRSFMFLFGGISSVFDLATFGLLFYLSNADPAHFRTGWFIESLLTELFVLFVMRTHLPLYRSPPKGLLMGLTLLMAAVTLILPVLPLGAVFELDPLPLPILGAVLGITVLYVGVTELAKQWFFGRQIKE